MVVPFPLLGEHHPLRQRATAVLLKSALLSMVLHTLFAGGRILIANRSAESEEFERQSYVTPFRFLPPPDFEPAIVIKPETEIVPIVPYDAIPEPVPYDPDLVWDPGPTPTPSAESEGIADSFGAPEGYVGGEGTGPTADGEPLIYSEGTAGTPPKLISMPMPEYPELAREAGVQGDVHLRVRVGTNGRVEEIQVVRGVPMLNDAAVEAVSGAVFRPAQHEGHVVASWVILPVRFELD